MLYDRRDFGLLRLAGAYQWLPLAPLRALSPLKQLCREAELLAALGLLAFSRNNEYLMPSPEGYQFLSAHDLNYQSPSKRPYAKSPTLRRRLEVGSILLTCLGAGIEPALDKVERLKRQPVFLPAFALRTGDGNLMNAAGCAGFGHWGNMAYMVQYVSENNPGFFMNNELAHLHNLASVFSERLDTPQALLMAGESYRAVYSVLSRKAPTQRNGKRASWTTARHIPGWVSRPASSPVTIPARFSWLSCVRRSTTPESPKPRSAHAGHRRTTAFRRRTVRWTGTRSS